MIAHRDTLHMRDGTRSHRDLEGEMICFILTLVFLKMIVAKYRLQTVEGNLSKQRSQF